MNIIYLTEEEFQNSKARTAETDKIDGCLKQIQPLYEAVRKFQPDALLLYCVSPSAAYPCFYRLHVGLIREGITFVLHQSYKDKKCYFEVETSMFPEAKGTKKFTNRKGGRK
jgi:isocitrate lyase